jgi:hypothetical protein
MYVGLSNPLHSTWEEVESNNEREEVLVFIFKIVSYQSGLQNNSRLAVEEDHLLFQT